MTFVDTSALLPFLDRDDADHEDAGAALTPVLARRRGVFREAGFRVSP